MSQELLTELVGEDSIAVDTKKSEVYGNYQAYLTCIDEVGYTQEQAQKHVGITDDQLDAMITLFEGEED